MTDDEVWQGYTPQGEPTNEPVTKPQAAKGALHGSAHVWIWRTHGPNIEILLQKRAQSKRTWPGYFDISAAGHLDFGEVPLAAALRETQEEIGLNIQPENLNLLFVNRQYMVAPGNAGVIENEFQWVYGYRLKTDEEMKYSDREVDATLWVGLEEFRALIAGKMPGEQIVPHGPVYFLGLTKELNRLNAA